ncbi:hypothetical protein BCON_0085g00280 [Botryotinia convoluta]|uniref:DUF7587 domain-containing protein n=1 Tax=Botryotinia convoluta TaxID=54673 RepID=A0A4Z1IGW7_9HELO|nr:hypothetical protein BCON_0085g00280 [Botryotinia convoluta]
MTAKLESDFAILLSASLPGNNDNDEPAIPLPKDLSTHGFVSSIGVQPSTPRFNPKNTFILTPEHTPPPLSSSPFSRSSADITSESNPFISGFGASSTTDPPSEHIKDSNTDTLLYRVHTATSKSPYDRTTGIRCSGWMDSLYNFSVTDERQTDGRAFQSHCNRDEVSSPYISVSTSVARLMRLPECKENQAESRVFVVSLNRLRQLGIEAQSTDSYLKKFVASSGEKMYKKNGGFNHKYENGVSYVTDTHWLVEEWIPDQAIVSEMNCGEFFKIAEREGIKMEVARKNPFETELEALKIDLEKWPKRDGSEQEKVITKPKYSRRINSPSLVIAKPEAQVKTFAENPRIAMSELGSS